jgi:hypothetical protein
MARCAGAFPYPTIDCFSAHGEKLTVYNGSGECDHATINKIESEFLPIMSIRFLSPLMTGCTVALLSFNVHANVLIGGGMAAVAGLRLRRPATGMSIPFRSSMPRRA